MNTSSRLFLSSAVVLCSVAEGRLWTNDEGQTLEADLVRVRGRTAFLKSASGEVPAPIARLSEEDQAYIERYKTLRRSREWGTGERAQFFKVDDESVRVLRGREVSAIPFDRLSTEDVLHVVDALEHDGETPPDALLRVAKKARPATFEITGDEPVRRWTNENGKEIEAAFLGTAGDRVVLAMRDKQYRFPIDSLSADDQAWIASRGLADLGGSGQKALSAFGQLAGAAMRRAGGALPMPAPRFNEPQETPPPGYPTPESTPPAQQGAPPAPTSALASEPAPEETRQPDPAQPREPTSPASAEPAAASGRRREPPWIDSVRELTLNEQEERRQAAFGVWVTNDEPAAGSALCGHCEAEFMYPAGFGEADTCPYCGVAMRGSDLDDWGAYDGRAGAPSSSGRWIRRIVIVVVITVVGAGVKMMTGRDSSED